MREHGFLRPEYFEEPNRQGKVEGKRGGGERDRRREIESRMKVKIKIKARTVGSE